MAVSLCPVASARTGTEHPLRISPRRPRLPPARCSSTAGRGAGQAKRNNCVLFSVPKIVATNKLPSV